jgi:AraC-like DNA-binding protein
MVPNQKYPIGAGWKAILAEVGVDCADVLRRAQLPEDLLNRDDVRLSGDGFLRFFTALDTSVDDQAFWVRFTEATRPEFFTPPVFASLCSPNLAVAAERVARFKPLLGPLQLDVTDGPSGLQLTYHWQDPQVREHGFMHGAEALFATQIARLGTRLRVRPTSVIVPALPRDPRPFEDFLGIRLTRGDRVQVTFSTIDAHRPFLTASQAMWEIFEPELRKRLADLEGDATFTERTRAVLMEGLPSGHFAVDEVARRLAVSSRTLQRRLRSEGTNFKAVVDSTREGLTRNYLRSTKLTSTEIAYLLGFEEPNSFFRAVRRWTGTTPERLRQQLVSDAA